jgi:ABC-2 type transport system permease protein
MKQLVAFTRKEFMEIIRTGKIYILLIIFVIFGIMNPAMAKLTPIIFELLAESMEEQGIVIGNVVVTAITSWEQYYKNAPMEFIVIIVMFGGILTNEYQKGTLINMLTKGLPRWKVIVSKSFVIFFTWTLCYWVSFGITYAYNEYFWDNSIASHVLFAASGTYLLGMWLISIILFSSVFLNSGPAVLLTTGAVYVVTNLLSMIPAAADYLPTKLASGMALLTGAARVEDYYKAIIITVLLIMISIVVSVVGFNRKKM